MPRVRDPIYVLKIASCSFSCNIHQPQKNMRALQALNASLGSLISQLRRLGKGESPFVIESDINPRGEKEINDDRGQMDDRLGRGEKA